MTDGDPPWASRESAGESEPSDEEPASHPMAAPTPKVAVSAAVAEPRKKKKEKRKKNYVGVVQRSLMEGQSESVIRSWLEKKGVSAERADRTIESARSRIDAAREAALEATHEAHEHVYEARNGDRSRQLAIGAGLFAIGLFLTVVTYSAAESGGGHYVLAWGPMVYGAIRFFRALGS